MHGLLNNNIPFDICTTFALLSSDCAHNTRNKDYKVFIVPHVNTQYFETYSIKIQCISIFSVNNSQ